MPHRMVPDGCHFSKYPFFLRKSVRSFSTREATERLSAAAAFSAAAFTLSGTRTEIAEVLAMSANVCD